MPKASWFDDEQPREAVVGTAEEAVSLLRSLRVRGEELPPIVEFVHSEDGASLTVGADDPTVLTYQRTVEPPYYVSKGDESAPGTLWFQYGGSESEFAASAAVGEAASAAALRQFFEEPDRLPDAVAWTEV